MHWLQKVLCALCFIGFPLAEAGSYDDYFSAIESDDVVTIEALIQRGFDPNTLSPKGQHALLLALKGSAVKVVDMLLGLPSVHIDVRSLQDETPLMLAALRGYTAVCQALIDRDADVNKPGWAPLHYAATAGHLEVIQLLLDHHAYIDAASPNGSTPLMMAAMYGSASAVKLLLESGADVGLKNDLGLTAVDFARRSKHIESVEILAAFIRARQPKGVW